VSLVHGGEQEEGLRAGMENLPAIAGGGVAAEIAAREMKNRRAHVSSLQTRLWDGLRERVPLLHLNGPPPGPERLPGHLNFSLEFAEGEGLALALDMKGFAVGAGSACVTESSRTPPVLAAIGRDEAMARGTLLLSLGADNTLEQVDRFIEVFPKVAGQFREMSPLWEERRASEASGAAH
jgi:cysteine desulfurase